ncbi:hypothetical protein BDD12DRAFT_853659 [Trichophaea hybrida]|nr:hypothetical protein BDD12DRAFT_853659 [Trichophaea hybrida]
MGVSAVWPTPSKPIGAQSVFGLDFSQVVLQPPPSTTLNLVKSKRQPNLPLKRNRTRA